MADPWEVQSEADLPQSQWEVESEKLISPSGLRFPAGPAQRVFASPKEPAVRMTPFGPQLGQQFISDVGTFGRKAASGVGDFIKGLIPQPPASAAPMDIARSIAGLTSGAMGGMPNMLTEADRLKGIIQSKNLSDIVNATAGALIPAPVKDISQKIGASIDRPFLEGQIPEAMGETAASAAAFAALRKIGMTAGRNGASPTAADNLAAALETGGKPSAGIRTFEDVAAPIIDDVRSAAVKEGIKPSQLSGREGYQLSEKIMNRVRSDYDSAFDNIFKPLQKTPPGEAGINAAKSFVQDISRDAEFVDKANNNTTATRFVDGISKEIAGVKTLGELNDFRKNFNQKAQKYFGGTEAQQASQPFINEASARAGNAIRAQLYGEMVNRYGETPEFNVQALRDFQKVHGAAIQGAQMMEKTASTISSAASSEKAPAPLRERFTAMLSPATYARPAHAGAGVIRSLLSPSEVNAFNVRMQRAIRGAMEASPIKSPTPSLPARSLGPLPSANRAQSMANRVMAGAQDILPRVSTGLEGADLSRGIPGGFVSAHQPPVQIPPEMQGQGINPVASHPITNFSYDPTMSTARPQLPSAGFMNLNAPDYVPTGEPQVHLRPDLLRERAKYDVDAMNELIRRAKAVQTAKRAERKAGK